MHHRGIQPLGACASGNLGTFREKSALVGSSPGMLDFQQELGRGVLLCPCLKTQDNYVI